MRLASLEIRDFRNIAHARIPFGDGISVLHGRNGQGKTSVLEAIFLLSCGRSHRTRDEREMIRFGADLFRVEARSDDGTALGYGYARDGRRSVAVGGAAASPADLVGRMVAVLFTPDDGEVVRGAPATRRRYFDMELSRLDRAHFDALRGYRRLLRQRNALLVSRDARVPGLLDAFDRGLAVAGAALVRGTGAFLADLSSRADALHARIPGASGRLEIVHRACVPDPSAAPEKIASDLYKRLESARDSDIVRGATSAGPHRDDARFRLDGRDLRDYGSQGQVKSAALALKLALMEHVRERTGRYPVLLLDDLTSELDSARLAFFLEHIVDKGQVLLTTTLPSALGNRALAAARLYRVEGGAVDVETA